MSHFIKMVKIDMRINTEKPLKNLLDSSLKLLRRVCRVEFHREHPGVIKSVLNPGHQQLHVLGGRHAGGLGVVLTTLPEVLSIGPGGHGGAGLGGAEVADGAVEKVDLVEEVDGVGSEPLEPVLVGGELNSLAQIPGAKSGLGLLVEVVTLSTSFYFVFGLESLLLSSEHV